MTLDEFWDAYWSDEAPYYAMSLNRDIDDYLLRSTVWGEPSPGWEFPGGQVAIDNGWDWKEPVLKERRYDKVNRIYAAFTPDWGDEFIYIQLLAKNETYIKILQHHIQGEEVPYADTFVIWMVWEMLTPDPLSHQVVFRKSSKVEWVDKPIVGKTIERITLVGLNRYHNKCAAFYQSSTINYLKGAPYEPIDPILMGEEYCEDVPSLCTIVMDEWWNESAESPSN